ncbi:MAG: hypothetical protein F6K30_26865 [Cyanothece sp. SIO2G6]|nr:hypothetical protein [Cyanothece sp. SIO2G6]
MLFDPEKPTRLDTDTTVPTGERQDAQRQCRAKAESWQQQGIVVRYLGVRRNRSGKSHQCIFEYEIDHEDNRDEPN